MSDVTNHVEKSQNVWQWRPKVGSLVRIKCDMIRVDGASIHKGAEFRVTRIFNVKTEHGIEPRVAVANNDMTIHQVRLDQIEEVEQ